MTTVADNLHLQIIISFADNGVCVCVCSLFIFQTLGAPQLEIDVWSFKLTAFEASDQESVGFRKF